MSLSHNPSIVLDGLVFAYDMGNPAKSWKGAPATNLITETNLNNWTKTAITSAYDLKTPFKAQAYAITDNNTGSYLSISRNITVANDSSSYTTSLFVKKTTGATSARLGFNIGFNTGGTTVSVNARFNSDTGVATTGTVVSQGDWWYWYFTISNNGTGNTNLSCAFYPATGLYNSGDNVIGVGTAIIGELMIVAGSVPARFVSGTRSNTQAILDLTSNNTITANSLTYNTDGSFSFNGSSNFISAPLSVGTDPIVTINQWIRRTADLNVAGYWGLGGGLANNGINGYTSVTNKIGWDLWGQTTFHTGQDYPLNTWVNVCWVKTATSFTTSTLKIYINGVEFPLTTTVRNNSSTVNIVSGITVGRLAIGENAYHAPGNVGVTKVYNRALTAAEVLQNYNALKGRYGL